MSLISRSYVRNLKAGDVIHKNVLKSSELNENCWCEVISVDYKGRESDVKVKHVASGSVFTENLLSDMVFVKAVK